MKPLPPPHAPGKTGFQRFDSAVRQVLTVSREELLEEVNESMGAFSETLARVLRQYES